MRNVFLFIRRYFNFLAFIALQVLALSFVVRFNKFHRASFLGVANEVTGSINTQYDKLDDYFHQGEENKRVHRMNDSLLNLLKVNFNTIDTGTREVVDTTRYDTLPSYRKYLWRDAKVVNNSVNADKNYIQIDRGAKFGIKDNMAVINSDGSAVGVVVNVSENFSQVMSLLHIQNLVNVSVKKTGEFGTIEWDGKDARFLTLKRIPKSVTINPGDTIVTSIYSNFPPGMMVGTVNSIVEDQSSNFYVLRIKPAANFFNLQQVFVVENLVKEEMDKLDKETRKKVEEAKRPG